LLFLGVAPITYIVGRSLFRGRAHNTPHEGVVWGVALACVVLWAVAISCWVADKFFCRFWSSLGIPYPQWHAHWHLFVLVASYLVLLLAAYFRACEEAPHLLPRLACWPPPNPRFSIGLGPWAGIPFIDFPADASQLKSHPSDVRAR
jgi:hypothetical protein